MSIINARPGASLFAPPAPSLRPRTSGIALWRPEIVLAKSVEVVSDRRRVLPGEPSLRPAAVDVAVDAAQAALDELTATRQRLGARVAEARVRAEAVGLEREHVTAVMETYRAQAALDAAMRATLGRLGGLLEERTSR